MLDKNATIKDCQTLLSGILARLSYPGPLETEQALILSAQLSLRLCWLLSQSLSPGRRLFQVLGHEKYQLALQDFLKAQLHNQFLDVSLARQERHSTT